MVPYPPHCTCSLLSKRTNSTTIVNGAVLLHRIGGQAVGRGALGTRSGVDARRFFYRLSRGCRGSAIADLPGGIQMIRTGRRCAPHRGNNCWTQQVICSAATTFFPFVQIIEHLDCLFCLFHMDLDALGGEVIADLVGNGKNSRIAGPDDQNLGSNLTISANSGSGGGAPLRGPTMSQRGRVHDHVARIVFSLNGDTAECEGLYFQRIPLKSLNNFIPR